jgi:UPF0716 family protein affecting phage T7 exclusion
MNKYLKQQINFLIVACITILFSIIGFLIFVFTKWIGIFPTVYLVTFMMGLGWFFTALKGIQIIKRERK